MLVYVAKRLLLMIPTTFGISLILWLVMLAAPGRPSMQAQDVGETNIQRDPQQELAKGEAQYLFRRQFALDRPAIWNSWTSLSEAEVRRAIETADAPIEAVGPRSKREAKEHLEDWGTYAVPSLVSLLGKTAGTTQDTVLYWLRRSASNRMITSRAGDVREENRRRKLENDEMNAWTWKPGDAAPLRVPAVAGWEQWFAAHRDRWTWSDLGKIRVALSDTQFGTYWGNLARLDLGTSHVYKRPVLGLILERLPVTLTLSFLSILIIYVLSIPLGIFSAVNAGSAWDKGSTISLFLLYSLPSFFIGTVLLRSMTVGDPWKWFPTSDFMDAASSSWNTWDRLKDTLWHISLPLITLTYGGLAGLSRIARTGMLDVIRSDFIRTARAKGLGEGAVILSHAARNGMMPVVTLLAGLLPGLIGGAVFVEYIFNMKGMGLLTIDAINNRDYNVVVGEALIAAILTQVGILVADVLYAFLDPRISFK